MYFIQYYTGGIWYFYSLSKKEYGSDTYIETERKIFKKLAYHPAVFVRLKGQTMHVHIYGIDKCKNKDINNMFNNRIMIRFDSDTNSITSFELRYPVKQPMYKRMYYRVVQKNNMSENMMYVRR